MKVWNFSQRMSTGETDHTLRWGQKLHIVSYEPVLGQRQDIADVRIEIVLVMNYASVAQAFLLSLLQPHLAQMAWSPMVASTTTILAVLGLLS